MATLRSRFGGLLPLVIAALVVGTLLRLVYPDDIHYLGDEAWMFERVARVREGGSWDLVGMPSSRGVKNAGLSVWIFYVMGIVSGASTPPGLTRAVAVLAIAARALMLVIPLRLVADERDRRAWLWAVVLSCTNPVLVFLDRKIWALVLPIFMVTLLIAWMLRDRRGAAAAWGFLGALIGQIHMPGFFFAAALAIWTRLSKGERPTRWGAWFLGSALGVVPAIPWLLYLAHDRPQPTSSPWWLRFRLEFYQYFLSDPTGLAGQYILGDDVLSAMRWPILAGHATWLVLVAHVVLAVATCALAVRAIRALVDNRRRIGALVRGMGTDTSLSLAAVLVGMGSLMTLPSISIHRHYMFATFPLGYVLFARIALRRERGERWLAALFGATTIVTFGFLSFVHDVGENAEMGKTYATQRRLGLSADEAKPPGHP